ncbi:MAG: potassium channel family protein [Desulfitobacteriaceae bacterium]
MLKRIIITFLALLSTVCFGALVLTFVEPLNLWEALYLTIQTVTTVGFGDIQVQTTWGRFIIFVLMLGGVGLMLYFFSLIMAFIIEGQLADVYGRRKMEKKIAKLRDHIIVCGAGRVGWQVIQRLRKEGALCVIIELKENLIEKLLEEGYLAVQGDATLDEVLIKVQIEHAKGLITAMPEDARNVFVTLTAKGLNPNIQVVSRMDKCETEKKLRHAGADKVISPAILGGWRMAMSILKPMSVEYIDTLFHDQNIEMEIEEFRINKDSCLVGRTLGLSRIKEQTGAIVIAIVRDNQVISNPVAQEVIFVGDLLIVFGKKEQLQRLEQVAASKETLKDED